MYFSHNHLAALTDNIYQSVFLYLRSPIAADKKKIHINIKLKRDSIDFFYTRADIGYPVNVLHNKHLFSIPLDSPERTDYFLLNTNDYDGRIKILSPRCLLYYSQILYYKESSCKPHTSRFASLLEVLLCLFDELNNQESDINKYSPIVSSQIRFNLEKSTVYQLIKKKFNFYKALFEWKTDNIKSKEGDVKAFFNDFLDIILKDRLAKTISIQKYSSENWFQNPQQELEYLISINNKYDIDPSSKKNIQNYLLKKHAILKACHLTFKSRNKWIMALQIISFLCYIFVFVSWQFQKYENTGLILVFGIIIFLLSFFSVIISKKTNLLMPRILVAMGLVLYAIVGSEVILKNQFLVDLNIVSIVFYTGLLILSFFLYYECRQHSPYHTFKHYMKIRVIPILLYSFNLAVILVILSQLIVSHKFIDNSKVISSSLFANEYKELSTLRDQYLTYQEKIRKAKEQNAFIIYLIMRQDFIFKNNVLDSSKLENCVLALNKEMNDIKGINQQIYSLKNLYLPIKETSTLKKDIVDRQLQDILLWETNDLCPTQLTQYRNCHNINATYNLLYDFKKLDKADSICTSISDSLTKTYDLYKDSTRILDSFLTYQEVDNIDTKLKYGFCFKPDRVYIVELPFGLPSIYPNMLMLQVIIVMLIGLVGQLIISDKTVTEPL